MLSFLIGGGNVRNVSVLVKPKQEGFGTYKASQGRGVSRHVSKLIVLVPAEDRCENAESSDSGLVASGSSHDVVLLDTVSSSQRPSQQDVIGKQAVQVDEEWRGVCSQTS